MTNVERQAKLDKDKWLLSEKEGFDRTGEMPYCFYCIYQDTYLNCKATQEERESSCLCAKAWNRRNKSRYK